MLIVQNLKNREIFTEGNKCLYSYYEMSLLKDFYVIRSLRFRFRVECVLCLAQDIRHFLCMQQIFIVHLLHARHFAKGWEYSTLKY